MSGFAAMKGPVSQMPGGRAIGPGGFVAVSWRIFAMHIVHVYVHVKPEFIEAFKQASVENAANSRKEPGVARFDVVQQADDPTRFALLEVYRDAGAPALHRETAHYKAWVATATDMMVEPRTRTIYTNIDPPDRGW
jgi:(4S)-4-hydroxy-5-phosphonooxypentane-2,3-dione isomerase